MPITVTRPRLNLKERFYVWEILRGLYITMRHFLYNIFHMSRLATLEYPEVKRVPPPAFRGLHRLLLRESGSLRCTACMLCATACPAGCISIEGAPHPDPAIEKYPSRFEIDLLRCIFCGLCVEACPCNAIDMGSGIYELAGQNRDAFILHRDDLAATPNPGTVSGLDGWKGQRND